MAAATTGSCDLTAGVADAAASGMTLSEVTVVAGVTVALRERDDVDDDGEEPKDEIEDRLVLELCAIGVATSGRALLADAR